MAFALIAASHKTPQDSQAIFGGHHNTFNVKLKSCQYSVLGSWKVFISIGRRRMHQGRDSAANFLGALEMHQAVQVWCSDLHCSALQRQVFCSTAWEEELGLCHLWWSPQANCFLTTEGTLCKTKWIFVLKTILRLKQCPCSSWGVQEMGWTFLWKLQNYWTTWEGGE